MLFRGRRAIKPNSSAGRHLGSDPSSKFSFYFVVAHDRRICYFCVLVFCTKYELPYTSNLWDQQVKRQVTSLDQKCSALATIASHSTPEPCGRKMQTNPTIFAMWINFSLDVKCGDGVRKSSGDVALHLGRWKFLFLFSLPLLLTRCFENFLVSREKLINIELGVKLQWA